MPSSAHRREWEYFNQQEPDEDVGAVAPRARFGMADVDGAAEVQPERRWRLIVGLIVLGGLALWLLPSTDEMLVRLRGEGYVHWHSVRWQAVQAAVSHQKPIVILRLHPSQRAAKRRLAREVLAAPAMQRLAERVIWFADESGSAGDPPTLVIRYLDDAEVLAGPWPAAEVTTTSLMQGIDEALAENQRLNDGTLSGS